jgi:hypothetical protein
MPYQTLPALFVCGSFVCLVGFGIQASQYLFLDRVSHPNNIFLLILSFQPKRRMNNEYVFQLDRRDLYIKLAKEELEKGEEVKNVAVFERRKADYSDFQNKFETYKIPATNKYLEKIRAADA